jgi:hypothetical protein
LLLALVLLLLRLPLPTSLLHFRPRSLSLFSPRNRVLRIEFFIRHGSTPVLARFFDHNFVGFARWIGRIAAKACGCLKYLAHRTAATGDTLMIFWIIPRVGRLATRGLRLLDSL